MGTSIFPSLAGLSFPVTRTPVFDTTVQSAISGKETRIARQSYPRWKWEISFSVLRSAAAFTEFQQLAGFFNSLLGSFDTFQYQDADDNAVTGQGIGTGDGTTTAFQLVRSFGGFVEPIMAPSNITSARVYLNGVFQSSGVSINPWGGANPGFINFNTPPGSGVVITADFTYYWPCRMSADSVSFGMFMSQFYDAKKFSFISVKN